MKTKLHHYSFNLTNPEESKAWKALKAKLEKSGVHCHNSHSADNGPSHRNDTETVEIETAHLFNDQWNTTDKRVFDWYWHYEWRGTKVARGHWLEITSEMEKARRECMKCGYCGHQYGPLHTMPIPESGFCECCLDSPYLKEAELYMLRLVSVAEDKSKREWPKLTAEESAYLLPRYIERQTTGKNSRAKAARDKQRSDVIAKFEKETQCATMERDGMLWLWDHGISLENVIFYNHSRKFCFGWRGSLDASVKSRLLDLLSEFPFEYEFHKNERAA